MKLNETVKPFLIKAFESWGGWRVADENAFFTAIETDAELVKELNQYEDQYLDTYDREWLFETVTSNTIGIPWPYYGDSEETKVDFVNRMNNSEVFGAYEDE